MHFSKAYFSVKWLHCTISFTENVMQIEEGHSEKLPLLLSLLNYESCMETSFLSTHIYDNETKLLALAKAGIEPLLAVTAAHQEEQLQLALHIPGALQEAALI